MGFLGIKFELGACRFTTFDADEFINAQPDGLGAQPRVSEYELHHTYGFLSRPLAPEVDAEGNAIAKKSCAVLIGTIGNEKHLWLCGDPRPIRLLPKLAEGESLQYGPAANFVRCKADGSVTLFTTTDGTYDGQSVYVEVAQDGIKAVCPWGKLELGANGFHMLHASGARIDAGAIGGLPAPLDSLGSYVTISAAMVQIEAACLALGTATGAAEPAAKATSLQAVLTSIATALSAINAAITTLTNGAGTVTSPNLLTATGAINAATSAISTGAGTIPSSTAVT